MCNRRVSKAVETAAMAVPSEQLPKTLRNSSGILEGEFKASKSA
jgi:hypothetical protein